MSEWTHNICDRCWRRREPNRTPVLGEMGVEICCFCGDATQAGIYVRHDPKDPMLKCGGEHEPEMIVG